MGQLDDDTWDVPKYIRFGYFDQSRISDELLKTFLNVIPGDGYLPARWRCDSYDQFITDYGSLGLLLWAPSASSHVLVLNGRKVLRIWTDASKHCWVEAEEHVLQGFVIQTIPSGNIRKSKPFTLRTKISTPLQMLTLAKNVKTVYGI